MKNPLTLKIDIFSLPAILIFFSTFLYINGIGRLDYNDYQYMTTHPFITNPVANRQFLYGSPFTFILGWPITHLFGVDTSFYIVHSTGLALFLLSLEKYLLEKFNKESINYAAFILMTTPVFFILTRWFGKSDTYLLAFLLAIYWLRSEWMILLASTLVILCHREMGSILLLFQLATSRKHARAIIAGLLVGNAGIYYFQHYALSTAPQQNRAAHVLEDWKYRIRVFTQNPLEYLAYSLGGFWIYIAYLARPSMLEVSMFAIAFALSIFGADSTRVFCILALPFILSITNKAMAHSEFLALHNKKIAMLLVTSTIIHYQVA